MKKLISFILLLFIYFQASSQGALGYQEPPAVIKELVDVTPAPTVRIDGKAENVVLLYRNAFKTIAELSETELRLGGLRINPKTNIGSRTRYYNNIEVKKAYSKETRPVSGLPVNTRLANFGWSPDEKMMSFTHTTGEGVEAWVLDVVSGKAKRITEANINANMGDPISWFADGKAMLIKMLPSNRMELINTSEAVPKGPTVSVSSGAKAQNRTYQDLLKNPNDEQNFEQLALSDIKKVTLDGKSSDWLPTAMYTNISLSPDGEYVMVSKIKRPFSYLVTYRRFPSESTIYTKDGALVSTVRDIPLIEVMPKGFMATYEGRRSVQWRNDQPATLVWAEALDGGDPEKEVDFRDEVFQLSAPFKGEGRSILKTIGRFSGIQWADEHHAVGYDYWWNTRNTKVYLFDPSNDKKKPVILADRNYQDKYNDPGSLVTEKNKYNRYTVSLVNGDAFLLGEGYSERGQFPFVDKLNLQTQKKTRIYESEYTDKLENLYSALDIAKGEILVRIESQTEYPNYYKRNIYKDKLTPMTFFENPFKGLEGVHKEVVNYKREDGLDLDGTLYLPAGYDRSKKEKLPMILWAYPREYKDKQSAGQSTSNPNEFIYPYYGSPIYWVTRGYVVLDNAAFPIVGEGDDEPNDSFREQLVANAKAAIDAVDKIGYIDRNRVGVGGHSYGAFMVANLLSHSNLFAAGIARSGAYNRTLTPFGFQSEERSYWDSPETYYTMSPFMHADKMKSPLLLVHGDADNNSGTYPMQSERYFNALKGLGATARLVMLPKESHGYRARESIMHLLWEQDQWLETYVKNRDSLEGEVVPSK
ncbi:S9 family peptidase [Fulvivirga sp. M361]|uniref:alpha/beta hydrolase family protein n=1 Tax=Fulvivirga sp. M361 TaxID=2594266 RepID=UPI00117AD1D2|nr:prolyl oligopeptidase family serine peptidase [Fulvivirga sp. M361]TRX48297.1 S9 family peptidase [Fulvivirga sp. M361]